MMFNYYGIYTSCRDGAWRCLLDFDIRTLPIKLIPLAKSAGIRVHRNSTIGVLRRYELGASIWENDTWHIVYDDRLQTKEVRMVLAHELGHIFLGHSCKYADSRYIHGGKKLKSEREADMFAIRLLAPAFLLHELGVLDAKGISELCDIPIRVAATRASRMETLERRASFYKSELERDLLYRFGEYIYNYKHGIKSNSNASDEADLK